LGWSRPRSHAFCFSLQITGRGPLGGRGPDVARADDGDLVDHGVFLLEEAGGETNTA